MKESISSNKCIKWDQYSFLLIVFSIDECRDRQLLVFILTSVIALYKILQIQAHALLQTIYKRD